MKPPKPGIIRFPASLIIPGGISISMFFTRVAVVLLLFSAGLASAASTGGSAYQGLFSPLWSQDVRGEVNNVRAVDLNGDGKAEVIVDSLYVTSEGKSGTIFMFDGAGQPGWKYLGGLLEDTYVSNRGYTIVGSGAYAELLTPSGEEVWKIPTRNSPTQSIYSQSVYAADLNGDGKDEAVVGTNYGLKGSVLNIRGFGKEELATITFKGLETPYALSSADFGGSSRTVLVGTIKYSPNTIGGTYTPTYSKPSTFYAFDLGGATRWSDNFEGGVSAVKACDINGDSLTEAVVGSVGRVKAYSNLGNVLWDASVDGQVHAIDCGPLSSNGSIGVFVGAGKVYAFDPAGAALWQYSSGEITALKAYDLAQDGSAEVILGSSSIRVLDSQGELVYKSDPVGVVHSIDVGDLNGDGYVSIVYGSKDHKVRVLDTAAYAQVSQAESYYMFADKAYRDGDFNLTSYYGLLAKDLYGIAGRQADEAKVKTLLDKSGRYSSGETYYNLTNYYFAKGEYSEAAKYAQLGADEYRKVNDMAHVNELLATKGRAQAIPSAAENLGLMRRYFAERRCANATYYAARVRDAYVFLGNQTLVSESLSVTTWCKAYDEFQSEVEEAYKYVRANNYGNATYHLSLADKVYSGLNDTSLRGQYDNVSTMANAIKRDENVVTYGGLGVVILIILLIVAAVFLVTVYLLRKGGMDLLRGMFGGDSGSDSGDPKPGGRGSLRELRGRSGESIGDSFKR